MSAPRTRSPAFAAARRFAANVARRFAPTAALALVSCYGDPSPPKVPGPTVAHSPSSPSRSVEIAPLSPRLVSMRNPESRVVSFRIVFDAGSSDDPAGREGLTSLTGALVAEGGTEQLTYPQLLDALYPMAAEIHAFVDRDETLFEAEVPRAALDAFYPIFRDVILAPRLDADGFARIKARAATELTDDLRGANDEALGKEALHALIYDGHPYGHPSIGTERGIAASTLDDVRAHRRRVLCRERLEIGVAGGFPEGFDRKLSEDLLAGTKECASARVELPPVKPKPGPHVIIVDKPTADATAISIGFPTELTRAGSDYPAIAFFTDYLGLHRQASGRLYQELREERGLNYGDYAYSESFIEAGGSRFPRPNIVRREQLVSMWVRPVKPKNAVFALRAALSTYRGLLEKGISRAEIERARGYLTRYVGLEQQTESRRLGYAMDDVAYGLPRPYLDTLRGGWSALDEPALRGATSRWLTANDVSIAIVARDGAALAASLARGAPSAPVYDGPKPPPVLAEDRDIAKHPLGIAAANVRVVPVADLFR